MVWPDGFHTSRETVAIDLRVGGRYELGMVQKDSGAVFPVRYEIIELDPPRLLVLKSEPMPEMGMHEPTFTRIELHDHGEKTRMSLSTGPTRKPRTPRQAGTKRSPRSTHCWRSERS